MLGRVIAHTEEEHVSLLTRNDENDHESSTPTETIELEQERVGSGNATQTEDAQQEEEEEQQEQDDQQEEQQENNGGYVYPFETIVPEAAGGDLRQRITTLRRMRRERQFVMRTRRSVVGILMLFLFTVTIISALESYQHSDYLQEQVSLGTFMLCVLGLLVSVSSIVRVYCFFNDRNETNDESNVETSAEEDEDEIYLNELSVAIMESQRMLRESNRAQKERGVSDETRASWETFELKEGTQLNVTQEKGDPDQTNESAPMDLSNECCSICLGHYEEGEVLVRLPCNHLFHEECVLSWTSNHIRCPLCNIELEGDPENV